MLEGLWQPSMSWLGTSLLLFMGEPPQAALIAHPDWINPLSCEGGKKAAALPLVTCGDTTLSASFPAYCVGKRSLRLFSICTHILGVLPSRQIALGTASRGERWFLPVLYLLPLQLRSSVPVAAAVAAAAACRLRLPGKQAQYTLN